MPLVDFRWPFAFVPPPHAVTFPFSSWTARFDVPPLAMHFLPSTPASLPNVWVQCPNSDGLVQNCCIECCKGLWEHRQIQLAKNYIKNISIMNQITNSGVSQRMAELLAVDGMEFSALFLAAFSASCTVKWSWRRHCFELLTIPIARK